MIPGHQISADKRRKQWTRVPSMDINWKIQRHGQRGVLGYNRARTYPVTCLSTERWDRVQRL